MPLYKTYYDEFQKKLNENKKYESEACKLASFYFDVEIKQFNDDYKYDFELTNNVKFEVKNDKRSAETDNICIEFSTEKEGEMIDSGITSTEAQYYIIVSNGIYHMLSVESIKKMISEEKYFMVCSIGKEITTFFYLFKKFIIFENSIELNE